MTAAERVIAQLEGVRRIREGEYRSDCPVCAGTSRTKFHIQETDDGVLVHCFGGCSLESILSALGMKSARELFNSCKAFRPDPEIARQRRIERGLRIWADRRLSFVCRLLREIDKLLSEYVRFIRPDNMTEANWETLNRFYKVRSDLECEWAILVKGDLQEIYDEIFRRLQ